MRNFNSKSLKVLVTASVISTMLVAPVASAATTSKEEGIGVSTGAVIGALAGGPIGFILGAGLGAKIGDTLHKKNESIDELQVSLHTSQNDVKTLENGVDQLSDEVRELQRVARPELLELMQAGIDMDLLFRTDEFALTDATGARLAEMAAMLAGMPEVQVQLDGFADERGNEDYNYALSEKRVEFVRSLLVQAGVNPRRIRTSAHGESIAQDANIDSYALERRVRVKLYVDSAQSLASNPN
ncbi:MAG: OmpA family protein [Gammaproteobacteria bacterium]|nr:OmpA family protein [Gammaproteobacteria bacterium]